VTLNPIAEFDLELLEAYLDDALSPGQVQHVAQRLLAEPELAAAMHDLRAERALRTAVWRTMEPSEAQAASVADRVAGEVHRRERWRRIFRIARTGSAVAAAVLVFCGGWFLGHSGSDPAAGEVHAVAPTALGVPPVVRAVQLPRHFEVPLKDRAGRVIAVQKFAREEEARQFNDDLMKYETRWRDVQQGGPVLVSDHF
jgi:hypothetical protein